MKVPTIIGIHNGIPLHSGIGIHIGNPLYSGIGIGIWVSVDTHLESTWHYKSTLHQKIPLQ